MWANEGTTEWMKDGRRFGTTTRDKLFRSRCTFLFRWEDLLLYVQISYQPVSSADLFFLRFIVASVRQTPHCIGSVSDDPFVVSFGDGIT